MAAKKRGGARSKKQSTEAKAESMKKAGAGENPRLNLPGPRDMKHHYDTITGYKARVDEAQGHYRNAVKQADEAGIDTKALLQAMRQSKKDPLVLKTFYSQLAAHLSNQGQPFQIFLFDTINGTPEEQAYKQGFAVGESGTTPENLYPSGSPPHAAYKRGVAHGIGKNLGQTPEQVDAALAEHAEGNGAAAASEGNGDTPAKKDPWPDDEQVQNGSGESAAAL